MGREATIRCTLPGFDDSVKALLESTELILRSTALRRRWVLSGLEQVRAQDGALRFTVGAEQVTLYLGEKDAAAWARKITSPPPSLASKLGLGAHTPAYVLGEVDDAELSAALQGHTTAEPAVAHQLIAVVQAPADLQRAMTKHGAMTGTHLWVIHRKGKGASPADSEIRAALRECGYRDTKVSAVSTLLTATRYSRAR